MKVSNSREAKFFYRNHPDVGCINIEADGEGFTFKTELSVKEAVSLVEDLIDIIQWVTNEEYNWERVTNEAEETNDNETDLDAS